MGKDVGVDDVGLVLPEIASPQAAACRVPTKAKSHLASCKATQAQPGSSRSARDRHDVRVAANRSLRRVNPAIVGEAWNRDNWTCPSRVVSADRDLVIGDHGGVDPDLHAHDLISDRVAAEVGSVDGHEGSLHLLRTDDPRPVLSPASDHAGRGSS